VIVTGSQSQRKQAKKHSVQSIMERMNASKTPHRMAQRATTAVFMQWDDGVTSTTREHMYVYLIVAKSAE